jgi:hypothetical protein
MPTRCTLLLPLLCLGLLTGCPAPPEPPQTQAVPDAPPSAAPPRATPRKPVPFSTPVATPSATPTALPSPSPSLPEIAKATPAPVVSTAPPGPPRPVSEGGVDRFPGLRVFPQQGRIEVDAFVNLNRCPTLEFMACTRRGKTHETLLRFECDPQHLHLALLLLGLEPTPQVGEEGEQIALDKGERVVIDAAWWARHTPAGDKSAPAPVQGVVRRRVEDMIFDQRQQRSMPRVGWVFTGSQMVKVPAPPDWETLKEVYAASYEGNIVATYHHPFVILDTPLIEGGDDTVYVPFTSRVPKKGTPVTVHIRIVEDEELEELRANQRKFSKAPTPPASRPAEGPAQLPRDEQEVEPPQKSGEESPDPNKSGQEPEQPQKPREGGEEPGE